LKLTEAELEQRRKFGQQIRQKSLGEYYKNPNFCKNCRKLIDVKENEPVSVARKKKFCSRSCAATTNNLGLNRRGTKPIFTTIQPVSLCENCGSEIQLTPKNRKNQKGRSQEYYVKRFCNNCRLERQRTTRRVQVENNGYTAYYDKINQGLTLGELKSLFKGRRYHWFRMIICRHARHVVKSNGRSRTCEVCGFEIETDVCHKKDVAKFGPDAKILDINANENLVVLCPNHHVMFDKGLIEII
jgi:hypothetical protein